MNAFPPPNPRDAVSPGTQYGRDTGNSGVGFQFRPPSRRFRRRSPFLVTNALISINVGIFLWLTLDEIGSAVLGTTTGDRVLDFVIARPFLEQGEWWRLVSAGFVHFGLLHVGLNMFLLYQLGRLIEPVIGPLRFGLLYGASLLGGSLGALVVSPYAATGGASGAVFGVMAASVVGVGQRGVNPLRTGLGVTFFINVLLTLAIPGISVGGHFGGAIIGAIVGALVLAPRSWHVPSWAQIVVPVVAGLSCVVIAFGIVGS